MWTKNRGEYESKCLPGYVGPLCQTCDVFGGTIYRKSGLFQCTECGDESVNIILLVMASGLIFVFYIILIKLIVFFNFLFWNLYYLKKIKYFKAESDKTWWSNTKIEFKIKERYAFVDFLPDISELFANRLFGSRFRSNLAWCDTEYVCYTI